MEADRDFGTITVEVAYALPEVQSLIKLEVKLGSTVGQAIEQSGVREEYPSMEIADVGIFSKRATLDQPLRDGDRVEIYRPLVANPREMRKKRARNEKSSD